MGSVSDFRPKIEAVNTNILRFNRNCTVSLAGYNKEIPVYRVPNPGCYKLADMYDMLTIYLLYNVTYILYSRAKYYVSCGTYDDQNLSAVLCARLGIMFNEMFSHGMMRGRADRHDVMLTLSDTDEEIDSAGILLEIIDDRGKVKAQVSLTEGMDYAVREVYDIIKGFKQENFPKNIGNFYDVVLEPKVCKVDFSKVIKPNILVERVMGENLPSIYSSDLSDVLSSDYICNLSLKSYFIANQSIVPVVAHSKDLNPMVYMNRLFHLTKDTFSQHLGGVVTGGRYNRDELYMMLVANMLFSTASKYRRAIIIESLSKHIDDTSNEFADYFELLNQNKTTVFYT